MDNRRARMWQRKSRYPGASQGAIEDKLQERVFSAISGNPSQLASLIDVVGRARPTAVAEAMAGRLGAPSRTDGPAAVYAALQQDEINGVREAVFPKRLPGHWTQINAFRYLSIWRHNPPDAAQ